MAEGHEIDLGTPGGSARHEHERRRTRREAETRKRHPYLGNLLLRVQSTPASEDDSDGGGHYFSGSGLFWFDLVRDDFLGAWFSGSSLSVKTESGLFVAEAR